MVPSLKGAWNIQGTEKTVRVKKARNTARGEAGYAILCSISVNHIKDSELYPKSSEKPLKGSEQKGKVRHSLSKDHSGCRVDNGVYKSENQGTGERALGKVIWGAMMAAWTRVVAMETERKNRFAIWSGAEQPELGA